MKKNKKVYRGEIYIADLGGNIGSEQGGVRPVLVIQNNLGNEFSNTTIVAPITTKKKQLPTHVKFINYKKLQVNQVLLEQLRCIDKSRLLKKIDFIEKSEIEKINNGIKIALGI